jgi:nicotinate-nucleotide adenylyltransferase
MTGTRVGILGGSFDPIHVGHLDAGAAAQMALGLTGIFFLPSSMPPHRPQPVASGYHRFAMVALATAGRRGWRALDLELRAASRSYTSDSLRSFHSDGFRAAELCFITGADAFLEIATWKDYPDLLDLAHFAVISRPGVSAAQLRQRLPALAARMRLPTEAGEPSSSVFIYLIDSPTADVSSTAIRRACAVREPIAGMVPAAVQEYLEKNALYQDAGTASESGDGLASRPASRLHGQS